MSKQPPFDAVLIIAFGGPNGPADIRPFLANVLRNRPVPPQRLEQVVRNYESFGGVSPLTEITRRQARGLEERLKQAGVDLPVYVGMRNWHPFLADMLEEMARDGVRRAIGFIAAAHHSYSSCEQYKENVHTARQELRRRGYPDITVTYVDSWYDHELFIQAIARHAEEALARLDPSLRPRARIVFTAHSLPLDMVKTSCYQEQLATSARQVMAKLGRLVTAERAVAGNDWALVYQSRSGRPEEPWLEPDIRDYLRQEHARRLAAAVIVPLGFLCDHIEVLYDLDVPAADLCRELNLPMVRAEAVNDDPLFLDMMAEVVRRAHQRFLRYPPLPIVSASPITKGA